VQRRSRNAVAEGGKVEMPWQVVMNAHEMLVSTADSDASVHSRCVCAENESAMPYWQGHMNV